MAKLLLWRILEPFIQALVLGSIQEARQKTVELSVEFPRKVPETKPWNFQHYPRGPMKKVFKVI